jgi:crotonobetainyl-CoA:carnitine CoA-transferase CaiB-like acyl-CoA transferase
VYRVISPRDVTGGSTADAMLNAGKELLEIDAATPEGHKRLIELIASADVLIEDDGVCVHNQASPELDYESLRVTNSRLVYCRIQAWWPGSDLPRWPTELEIQALTGQMAFMGRLNEAPARSGADVTSFAGAVHAMIGITGALYARELSGVGQRVDISAITAALSIASHWIADFSDPDEFAGGNTSPYSGPDSGYRCADGRVMFGFFGRRKDRQDPWQQLCTALGLEGLLDDPFIREHGAGIIGGGRDALLWRPLVEERTQRLTTDELMDIVLEIGGTGAPLMSYGQLFSEELHPQIDAVGSIIEGERGGRAVVSPWIHDIGDVSAVRQGRPPRPATEGRK